MNRRGILGALLAAPVLIRTPGLLMPVKPLAVRPVGVAWPAWTPMAYAVVDGRVLRIAAIELGYYVPTRRA